MPVIVPYLMGGLGNQLFQVASACTFSSLTGNQIYLSYNHRQSSPHTDKDYFRNVFKKLNREQVNIPLLPVNEGPKLQSFDVEKYLEIAKQKIPCCLVIFKIGNSYQLILKITYNLKIQTFLKNIQIFKKGVLYTFVEAIM